jgi:hypothetical protein
MIDLGLEGDDRRLERIVAGKVDAEVEDTALEGRRIRAEDHCLPGKEVTIGRRPRRTVGGRVALNVSKFALESTESHRAFGAQGRQ